MGLASTSIYGIDGYIRPSTTVALQGNEARVNWINLCGNIGGSCNQWVQIGTYQGKNPNGGASYTASHVFIENNWGSCSYYSFADKGTLANANQAYYITSTGGSTSGCGGTQHEFSFRKISYTSSPIGYGYMASSAGQAIAETELHVESRTLPQNTDYFGTNDSHVASASYGLHVQTSLGAGYYAWTTSQVSPAFANNPPSITVLTAPWAFATGP